MATTTSKKTNRFSWRFDSPAEMQAWGRQFARQLRRGDVVALIGGLGAGKTTLVQGIAVGLGFRQGASSPTFALANEYRTPRGNVYHMDMYRLSERELAAFPLEEYWNDGVCLIEWADRVQDRWPAGTLELRLSPEGRDRRWIRATRPDGSWEKRLSSLTKRKKKTR